MGGKAFEGITSRIDRDDIEPTLRWLQQYWTDYAKNGGQLKDHMLGSAGKNDTSGDIDLNLRIEAYDQAEVAQQLIAILGPDHVKARPGNNQIFTAVPVSGRDAYVQIDFMFGDYDWQEFSYFSPSLRPNDYRRRYYGYNSTGNQSSSVKGLYRTELIKALTAYNSDWVLEENGEMVARVGPTFFHDRGLVWRYRHRPMRKDGTARVKALEELSEEDFLAIYPSAQRIRIKETRDIDGITKMLIGDWATKEHFASFEILWQMIRNAYTPDEVTKIGQIYLERLNSLKVEIPTEVFRNYGLRV